MANKSGTLRNQDYAGFYFVNHVGDFRHRIALSLPICSYYDLL